MNSLKSKVWWWCMPLTLALETQRQRQRQVELYELETDMVCLVSSRPARPIKWEPAWKATSAPNNLHTVAEASHGMIYHLYCLWFLGSTGILESLWILLENPQFGIFNYNVFLLTNWYIVHGSQMMSVEHVCRTVISSEMCVTKQVSVYRCSYRGHGSVSEGFLCCSPPCFLR